MKRALAIRHVDFEDLGILAPLLRERGYEIRYFDATVDDFATLEASAPDLLVVLGGPISVYEDETYPFLADELAVLRRRLERGAPTLGVCLGAQLMACAMGAKVYSLGVKEIGFSALELSEAGRRSPLAAVGDTPVLHWHGDQFDVPAGAERLAGTHIGKNQVFELGANVLALQCHLEADLTRIERWLVGHACELGAAGIDPRQLRTRARQLADDLHRAGRAVFSVWLDGLKV
ncbi:MAG: glutamine amidotransferase [Azoarcus sp.]|nr:glutamine amidotransferase [Azoarcus sp.]